MHIVVSGVLVSLPALVAVGLAIGFVAGMFGVAACILAGLVCLYRMVAVVAVFFVR